MGKIQDWKKFREDLDGDFSFAHEILEGQYGDEHPEDYAIALRELLRMLFKITVEENSE